MRNRPLLTEANFWQPSPHGFRAKPGEPFLFKTKNPQNFRHVDIPGYALVGGGFFDEYVELRASEAWMIWGEANGVVSEDELICCSLRWASNSTSRQLARREVLVTTVVHTTAMVEIGTRACPRQLEPPGSADPKSSQRRPEYVEAIAVVPANPVKTQIRG